MYIFLSAYIIQQQKISIQELSYLQGNLLLRKYNSIACRLLDSLIYISCKTVHKPSYKYIKLLKGSTTKAVRKTVEWNSGRNCLSLYLGDLIDLQRKPACYTSLHSIGTGSCWYTGVGLDKQQITATKYAPTRRPYRI